MSTGSSKNASACFQCLLIVPIFCSSPVATGSTFCCLNTTVSHSIVSLQCLNSQHVKPPFLFQPIIAITSISLPPDNKVCLIGEKNINPSIGGFLNQMGLSENRMPPRFAMAINSSGYPPFSDAPVQGSDNVTPKSCLAQVRLCQMPVSYC